MRKSNHHRIKRNNFLLLATFRCMGILSIFGHSNRTGPKLSKRSCKSPSEIRIDKIFDPKMIYSDSDHVEYHREKSCMIMRVVAWKKFVVEQVMVMSISNLVELFQNVLQSTKIFLRFIDQNFNAYE
jgi:hypothetical protein